MTTELGKALRQQAFRKRAEDGAFVLTREDFMGKWKFEIYPRRGLFGRWWYFRLKADNGEIVAQSEGYRNKVDCYKTVSQMQFRTQRAEVVEVVK